MDYRRRGQVLDYMYLDGAPDLRWENPFKAYRVGSLDDVAKASILTKTHEAIVAGTPAQYGPPGARADLEIWFAMAESQRLGNAWVDVPLPGPTELSERIERTFVEKYGHDPIAGSRELLDCSTCGAVAIEILPVQPRGARDT